MLTEVSAHSFTNHHLSKKMQDFDLLGLVHMPCPDLRH